jgi:hypothetical protein
MTTMRRGAWIAAALLVAGLAQAGSGFAQTASPPDPLAPGAAAESAQPEKAEKPSAEKADAETTAKPEHKKAKRHHSEVATLTVTVHNERSVGLMQLSVVPAGDPEHKKVLGALAFGRKTVIHIKRTKGCLYDIRGQFADGADSEQLGVELCTDKTINLMD